MLCCLEESLEILTGEDELMNDTMENMEEPQPGPNQRMKFMPTPSLGNHISTGCTPPASTPPTVAQSAKKKLQESWIGGLLGKLCEAQGINYTYGSGRLENRESLEADINGFKPTHVFNAAGVTGRPNVDWCESHKVETVGCIFEYDEEHLVGSGVGFKEEDVPNFFGSYYSKTKAMVEDLLANYENVCTLRVRMPISSDLSNPRNFITKITQYNKVVNIPNSMTILDELLPISVDMAKRNLSGIWNFTKPGVVSHNEILQMYRDYIDPFFTWKNFNLEEQAKVIIAPRSNNELDAVNHIDKDQEPKLQPDTAKEISSDMLKSSYAKV
ncbi:hypothetical protein AgCh_038760 [Apium graveolens]